MKAKQLFQSLNEASAETPGSSPLPGGRPPVPGQTSGARRPMRRPQPMDPDQIGAGSPDVARMGGPPAEAQGQFSKQELASLIQVLLLIATEGTGNTHDGAIARKLIAAQPLEPGELQHIMDEVRRLQDVPKNFDPVLEKIFGMI